MSRKSKSPRSSRRALKYAIEPLERRMLLAITLDLKDWTDTGVSNSDDNTNRNNRSPDTSLIFVVSGTSPNLGTVTIYADGSTIGSSPAGSSGFTWVTTDGGSVLADGNHSILAMYSWPLPNFSSTLTVTIDTVAPSVPGAPDLQSSSDTGVSSTDNITKDTTPTFNLLASPYFRFYKAGVQIGGDYQSGSTYTMPAAGDNTSSYWIASMDVAGNVSAQSSGLSVTIDTTAPATPSAPDLQFSSDTGISRVDNVTSDTTPTFDFFAAPFYRFYRNGSQSGTDWQVGSTCTTPPQADGLATFTIAAVDEAGNVSAQSAGVSVTIDTVAPATPLMPDLQSSSDSGISSEDNLTNDYDPTFNLSGASPYFRFYRDATQVSGSFEPASSTYTESFQSDGTYFYRVEAVDAAGNVSGPSAGVVVTIDTVAPPRPAAPDLQDASDTGVSSTDNITNDTTPTFNLSVSPYFRFYRSSAIISGNYESGGTYTPPTQPDGGYFYSVAAVDEAGNASTQNFNLWVSIDTVAPHVVFPQFEFEAQQRVVLSFNEDVGASLAESDFSLVLLPGSTLVSKSMVHTLYSATFTFGATLADGNYRLSPVAGAVTDIAGNAPPASYSFDFFVLAGDTNRDRLVDVLDLYVLALNWLQTGRTFSQGDFDHSGLVDAHDLGILAMRWQQRLDPPALPSPPLPTGAASRAASRTPTRIASLIL